MEKTREVEFYQKQLIDGLAYVLGENDPFSGNFIYRYPNGEIKTIEPYINGLKEGTEIKFYENGQVKESIDFKAGHISGDSIQYYENGQMKEYMGFLNDWRMG